MNEPLVKTNKRSRVLLAGVILVVALVWVSMNVWTAPIGMVWHLFNGNFISFNGNKIRVPRDMWVSSSGNENLTILRQAPKYPVLHSPSGVLVFIHGSGPLTDMSKNYDKIAQANEQTTHGLQPRGVRKIAAAKGTVYCWESANSALSEFVIFCWFDKDTLAASYAGTSNYRDEFYETVSQLADAPKP